MIGNEWIIKYNFWLLWAISVPICTNAASSKTAVDFNKLRESNNFSTVRHFQDVCESLQTLNILKSLKNLGEDANNQYS